MEGPKTQVAKQARATYWFKTARRRKAAYQCTPPKNAVRLPARHTFMKINPRWLRTKGSSTSELAIAAPQEYSCTSFIVKERISFPPSTPIEGLNRMPNAPAQINRNAQKYRDDAPRNFTAAP
jgi:hypothetical protein